MRFTVRYWQLILVLSLALGASACGSKKSDSAEMASPEQSADMGSSLGSSDDGNAEGLQTVYYGYDSSVLDSQAKSTLKENAKILKAKANLKVQIEGNCDERGGIQYNIALGERRAKASKAYMADQGVSGDRVSIISYGKEKPVDPGHDEAAWAKNRRANFRITEK